MSEKVKVSREVADALKCVLSNGDFDSCIFHHMNGWTGDLRKPLNQLTTEEFARCFLIGYETELTPEEKWTQKYKDAETTKHKEIAPLSDRYIALGIIQTIQEMARDFNLNIEGVN